MASPYLKHTPSEAQISVKHNNQILTFKTFTFTHVKELKSQISQLTGIPPGDQHLYIRHIELSNNRRLDDYDLFKYNKPRGLVLECKKIPGSFIRIVPGAYSDPLLHSAIDKSNQGLMLNLAPQLTWDGTSGVYLLRDISRNIIGVFKPIDEEAFAPQNPRGYVNKLYSPGFRPGIKSGESAFREIAAFLLDYENFSGVPATGLAESLHPTYKYSLNDPILPKKGSFQVFVKNKGSIEDFSINLFSRYEVQKIAVLDLRILNMDRNEANILVNEENKLIPIDHSLAMPECIEISEYDLCWMNFPQCKEKTEEKCIEFIRKIEPLRDIMLLKESMPISDKSLTLLRSSSILLKKGTEAGLTLQQIGSLICRKEDDYTPSVLEKVISKSIELNKSIQKSLKKKIQLKKHNKHNKSNLPFEITSRSRAYSSNSEEEFFDPVQEDETHEVFVTIHEVDNEEEDELEALELNFRSHSLPSLDFNESKSFKETGQAFNSKLFNYVESFIDLAIQRKVKEVNSN